LNKKIVSLPYVKDSNFLVLARVSCVIAESNEPKNIQIRDGLAGIAVWPFVFRRRAMHRIWFPFTVLSRR
jgi:hypothetical protein